MILHVSNSWRSLLARRKMFGIFQTPQNQHRAQILWMQIEFYFNLHLQETSLRLHLLSYWANRDWRRDFMQVKQKYGLMCVLPFFIRYLRWTRQRKRNSRFYTTPISVVCSVVAITKEVQEKVEDFIFLWAWFSSTTTNSCIFLVEENELDVINAVYTKKNGVKLGFIDFYVASYYSDFINRNNLDIVSIIPRNRACGVLLGKDWAPHVVDCLRRHSEDNRHVIHEVISKYIGVSEVWVEII